jgi:hypothetical protein
MAHWLARLLKHRMLDEGDARRMLDKDALARIEARVAESEKRHSGEIRVVVEAGLPFSYLRRGCDAARAPRSRMFGKLGVWDTERNNGVLIYSAARRARDRDRRRPRPERSVPAREWARIAASMQSAFREAASRQAGCARSTPSMRSCPPLRGPAGRRRRQRAARRAAHSLSGRGVAPGRVPARAVISPRSSSRRARESGRPSPGTGRRGPAALRADC